MALALFCDIFNCNGASFQAISPRKLISFAVTCLFVASALSCYLYVEKYRIPGILANECYLAISYCPLPALQGVFIFSVASSEDSVTFTSQQCKWIADLISFRFAKARSWPTDIHHRFSYSWNIVIAYHESNNYPQFKLRSSWVSCIMDVLSYWWVAK